MIALGRTLLQDIYSSTPLASTIVPQNALVETSYTYRSSFSGAQLDILLQPPTADEITKYFSMIHPLKYSQPHQPLASPFSPPLNDLTITAYNAGHSLGGTIWHIQNGMESVVYAVDWNQVRENVFAGAAWLGGSGGGGAEVIEQLRKPTTLICSARGAEKITMAGGRKRRDECLLDLIRGAISRSGTVLIPTDSSARVLELAYILDHAWQRDTADLASERSLRKAKLYLASKTAQATMRQVRSMLEWMDESVVKELESEATNSSARQHKRNDSRQSGAHGSAAKHAQTAVTASSPFEFKFLKIIESRRRIDKISKSTGPCVILASDASLEWGFSKDVLTRIAVNSSNLLIFTNDMGKIRPHGSHSQRPGDVISQWYNERADGVTEFPCDAASLEVSNINSRELIITKDQCIALEGKELLVYQQFLAARKQAQEMSQGTNGSALETNADGVDEASSESSSSTDESDPERQGKALKVSAQTARFNRGKAQQGRDNLGVNVLVRQSGVYDYDVRGKKGRDQMFPLVNKRRRADEFGDLIKPEEYLRAEERDDANNEDIQEKGPASKEAVGQKRKWQDPRNFKNYESNTAASNRPRSAAKISGAKTSTALNGANGLSNGQTDSSSEDSGEESETSLMVPSKLQRGLESISVKFQVAALDFSGIHDQRSLTMLIPLIQPKKVILVGGNPSETVYLANDCRQKLGNSQSAMSEVASSFVFTPSINQTVDASVDTNAWDIKLGDALVRRFQWQNLRNLSIVTLMGELTAGRRADVKEEMAVRKKLKLSDISSDIKPVKDDDDTELEKAVLPMLDVISSTMASDTRSATQPLHVGDLRLADLRKVLQTNGHTADFRGEGTLLVDNLVAVRKAGNGTIEVESGGCDQPERRIQQSEGAFYVVKRKIYECLAVIAGG